MEEAKPNYSGRHKFNGLKPEVTVMFNGQAIRFSSHAPWNDAYIDLFIWFLDDHQFLVRKYDEEKNIMHVGLYGIEFEDMSEVLCDKGYQGILEVVCVIHTKKIPLRRALTMGENRTNAKVSLNRTIV